MPGSTPVASFEDPLTLLEACHGKIIRFCQLALKLDTHLGQHGCDAQAREAACDILRYFDIAAPLHHADEEEDLYPALLKLGNPALQASIAALEAEHDELGQLWREVRPWLSAISEGGVAVRPAALHAFTSRYPRHAEREEREVYPHAEQLSPQQRAALGLRMQARRGARA